MKLKIFTVISCLFFFTNIALSAPEDEIKKSIKKLPRYQRKILQQIDQAATLTKIPKIRIHTKISKRRWNRILKSYAKVKE